MYPTIYVVVVVGRLAQTRHTHLPVVVGELLRVPCPGGRVMEVDPRGLSRPAPALELLPLRVQDEEAPSGGLAKHPPAAAGMRLGTGVACRWFRPCGLGVCCSRLAV